MNYTQLTTAIQSYVENEFTTTDINVFITQAEQRIYNTVQIAYLRKNVTGALTQDKQYLTLPSDWLDTFSLAVLDSSSSYSYLINKDVNFIREAYPVAGDNKGLPQYYALFDDTTLILGPTPDSGYTMELHYYYYPETITTATTTWIGDNFSSVLLYGSILEAYTFLKGEPDMMAEYQKRYDTSLVMLKELAEYKNRNDTYRAGQGRSAVV
jgi:hypothetical protein|tara:strand:+ start:36 stop:668 length:633 start_codon:yes stop_codon:yes gene_type:complete